MSTAATPTTDPVAARALADLRRRGSVTPGRPMLTTSAAARMGGTGRSEDGAVVHHPTECRCGAARCNARRADERARLRSAGALPATGPTLAEDIVAAEAQRHTGEAGRIARAAVPSLADPVRGTILAAGPRTLMGARSSAKTGTDGPAGVLATVEAAARRAVRTRTAALAGTKRSGAFDRTTDRSDAPVSATLVAETIADAGLMARAVDAVAPTREARDELADDIAADTLATLAAEYPAVPRGIVTAAERAGRAAAALRGPAAGVLAYVAAVEHFRDHPAMVGRFDVDAAGIIRAARAMAPRYRDGRPPVTLADAVSVVAYRMADRALLRMLRGATEGAVIAGNDSAVDRRLRDEEWASFAVDRAGAALAEADGVIPGGVRDWTTAARVALVDTLAQGHERRAGNGAASRDERTDATLPAKSAVAAALDVPETAVRDARKDRRSGKGDPLRTAMVRAAKEHPVGVATLLLDTADTLEDPDPDTVSAVVKGLCTGVKARKLDGDDAGTVEAAALALTLTLAAA